MNAKRLYLAVAACAVVAHVGALWNGFAMDDLYIIVWNPLVHSADGIWRAFTSPYWPPDLGGKLYRPLAIASYALDGRVDDAPWFHAVNLLWHAGAAVAVAALARRWAGATAALAAGLIFAVHPVHVEAIANVIGRAELMAAVGACLAVYAAVVKESIGWSALALVTGLLSKENAAVAPGLILWAWALGFARPPRHRMLAFVGSWLAIAAVYVAVRGAVLEPYARLHDVAPVFVGQSPVAVRLTAVAMLADVVRLLLFPLTLRADYSPAERTLVTSVLDGRFLLGLGALVLWAGLLVAAWRHGRRIEAFGLGWIAIAFLPVANLLFPVGILLAERTLYLPSVGLALAVGASLARLPPARVWAVAAVLVLAGGIRSALRVPVWHDDAAVTLSILEDSPNSYRGPARMGALYQSRGETERALNALRIAARTFDWDAALYVAGADAAFTLGRPALADSLLTRAEQICYRCAGLYRTQALAARARGDSAVADSLLRRGGGGGGAGSMKPAVIVFVAAVALYLPTVQHGFVQDDRAIIAGNPAAHSIGAALRAFDDPYWPRESGAGLYRPVTILSYAVDWSLSNGRAGWLHLMNALWHGLAAALLTVVLARWLTPLGAAAAGLLFAWHPVHVEAVASLVGRAELLAAVGILGAVLAARRGWWAATVACAVLAMLSKEHGVIVGVAIVLDNWLRPPSPEEPALSAAKGRGGKGVRAPVALWIALGVVTTLFLVAWLAIGRAGASDVAAVFIGRGVMGRLAVALPAVARAAGLLIWPASLSADYGPQVIAARTSLSLAAVAGAIVVITGPLLVAWFRRRAPAIAFLAALTALSYLPTSNLIFPSGVVLAERNLYLPVALAAVLIAMGLEWVRSRWRGGGRVRPAIAAFGVVALAYGARSFDRLPAWQDNRSQLLTLLAEHPESYRAHASAAAVLAGLHDTAGARREYRAADSLFSGDPHLDAAHALYLLGLGDTAAAAPLVRRARSVLADERIGLRAQFLLELARGNRPAAALVADSAETRYPWEKDWYISYLQ